MKTIPTCTRTLRTNCMPYFLFVAESSTASGLDSGKKATIVIIALAIAAAGLRI